MVYVHQIWLQGREELPDKYSKYADEYSRLNPMHRVWSEKEIRDIIVEDYPDLIETYDSYEFWVMKVDLAKYVLLHKYGGFYVDMDTKPSKSFDGMIREYPVFYDKNVGRTAQTFMGDVFLNNNFLFSPYPGHELFSMLIKFAMASKQRMFYDMKIHYILYSIGPGFMMDVVRRYVADGGVVVILPEKEIEMYFKDEEARTWLTRGMLDGRDKIILIFILCLLILACFILSR